jgi:hypothetical protein
MYLAEPAGYPTKYLKPGDGMKKVFEFMNLSLSTAELMWKAFTVLVILAGGTTAGILAKGTQLFESAGLLVWYGIGLAACLIIAIIFFIVQASQRAAAQANLTNALASRPTDINPLLASFENRIIPVHALHLPGTPLHEHKQFKRCKFVGPGAIALLGGTFVNSKFLNTGHILTIPDNTYVTGIPVLKNCTIEDCDFLQVTLIVPRSAAKDVAKIQGVEVAL